MATVDEITDEILATELTPQQKRKAKALFEDVPHMATLLLYLEEWYQEVGDDKAYRIVEKCTLALATHEAETE